MFEFIEFNPFNKTVRTPARWPSSSDEEPAYHSLIPPTASAIYANILYRSPAKKLRDTFFIFHGEIGEGDNVAGKWRLGLLDYATFGLLAACEAPAFLLINFIDERFLWLLVLMPVLIPAMILCGVSKFIIRPLCAAILTLVSLPFVALTHFIVDALAQHDFELVSKLLVTDLNPEEKQRSEPFGESEEVFEVPASEREKAVTIERLNSTLDTVLNALEQRIDAAEAKRQYQQYVDDVTSGKQPLMTRKKNIPTREALMQARPRIPLAKALDCSVVSKNLSEQYIVRYAKDCNGLYVFKGRQNQHFALPKSDIEQAETDQKLAYQALLRLNLFRFAENHEKPYKEPHPRSKLDFCWGGSHAGGSRVSYSGSDSAVSWRDSRWRWG